MKRKKEREKEERKKTIFNFGLKKFYSLLKYLYNNSLSILNCSQRSNFWRALLISPCVPTKLFSR